MWINYEEAQFVERIDKKMPTIFLFEMWMKNCGQCV